MGHIYLRVFVKEDAGVPGKGLEGSQANDPRLIISCHLQNSQREATLKTDLLLMEITLILHKKKIFH